KASRRDRSHASGSRSQPKNAGSAAGPARADRSERAAPSVRRSALDGARSDRGGPAANPAGVLLGRNRPVRVWDVRSYGRGEWTMTQASAMLDTYPADLGQVDKEVLVR